MDTFGASPAAIFLRGVALVAALAISTSCSRHVAGSGAPSARDDAPGAPPPAQNTARPREAALEIPVELAPGETALVGPDRLEVTFVSIAEDSRCPEGVQCVWAGRAVAEVRLRAAGSEPADVRLETTRAGETAAYAGYTVRLLSVAPSPKKDEPVRPEAYRVTLTVARK
jgi:hypothetical protein